jgi:hypothetical protein
MRTHYIVMMHRAERYGPQLDVLFVGMTLGFYGTAVAAVQAARAHHFAARRKWALRHIAYGHGVSAQRLLLMIAGLLVPRRMLACEDNRRLLFSLLALAGIVLNASMLELYFFVARYCSSSGTTDSGSISSDKVLVCARTARLETDMWRSCGR